MEEEIKKYWELKAQAESGGGEARIEAQGVWGQNFTLNFTFLHRRFYRLTDKNVCSTVLTP